MVLLNAEGHGARTDVDKEEEDSDQDDHPRQWARKKRKRAGAEPEQATTARRTWLTAVVDPVRVEMLDRMCATASLLLFLSLL
jgi:hypothetical protein